MLKSQITKTIGSGLLLLLMPLTGFAQESVNLENLEKSYWSAKDDEFSVVQNRAFSKKKRYSLTAQYGTPINDPYVEGSLFKVEADYYFNERWGVGVNYKGYDLSSNSATQTFTQEHNTVPNHNSIKSFTAASLYFAPLYAKMSLVDKYITYFDMGIGVHVGNLEYELQRNIGNRRATTLGYGFSVFQQFYMSQNFAFRWDFETIFSSQDKDRYKIGTTEPESARSLGSKNVQNTSLSIGITFWK